MKYYGPNGTRVPCNVCFGKGYTEQVVYEPQLTPYRPPMPKGQELYAPPPLSPLPKERIIHHMCRACGGTGRVTVFY